MTKVFVADKSSYGSEFYNICDSLDELKREILYHEIGKWGETDYTPDKYTEELFKEHSKSYKMFEVDLHDEEEIQFQEYDGQSWFHVVKKDPMILSKSKRIEE